MPNPAPSPFAKAFRRPALVLLPLAWLALLVHGYHLGVDDAEIFVPAIKQAADPALYPFGSEFFTTHAHLTLFPALVGGSARLTHLPVDLVILLWHVAGIFLLLAAAWKLLSVCFEHEYARWSGVALLAAAFSVPVAGTALVIVDPYVTARTLSTPATIFAIASYVSNQRLRALAWLVFAALVHPQMSLYGAAFLALLEGMRRFRAGALPAHAFAVLPFSRLAASFGLEPARGPAREALYSRTYFFLGNWAWYEWAGVFAPLALLWWLSSRSLRGVTPAFRFVSRALVAFGLLFTAIGVALTLPAKFENLTRLQPMRAFHLVYVVFFALLGGVVGEYLLRRRAWRWLSLFGPLAVSMWLLQQSAFPASRHVEWPGWPGHNAWTDAFYWVRGHTPKDAVFALDPKYMLRPGDDQHGFRAVAERSALAEAVKDSGAVSLFPQLAGDWDRQVRAQTGWAKFDRRDFVNLAQQYPVTWIITRSPGPAGLTCPYENPELAVCRIDGSPVASSSPAGSDSKP